AESCGRHLLHSAGAAGRLHRARRLYSRNPNSAVKSTRTNSRCHVAEVYTEFGPVRVLNGPCCVGLTPVRPTNLPLSLHPLVHDNRGVCPRKRFARSAAAPAGLLWSAPRSAARNAATA